MEATSLVKSTVKQLGTWMAEEVKYLYAVKGKIEGLQSELEWIQCFLRSADEMRTDNEMVRKWISDISDFSYEAEDILEEYLLKVSHPREEGTWNLLKWITCVAGDAESTHQVGAEIDKLTSKISKMTARMINYNVIPTSYENHTSSLSRKAELRRTHSYIPVDDIIGLKNDTADVINKLMNTEIKATSIVANAGSGKTTLARKVYRAVKGHQFEMCAWIYVSQKPEPRDVIKKILLRLYADDNKKIEEIQSKENPERMLYEALKEKRCLVVLDDLWECTDWDLLEKAFPIRDSRSKLLITTRKTELLAHVDPQGYLHFLQGLTHQESLDLFNKKAYLDKDTTDPDTEQLVKEKKDLGEKMVKKCKGLPLAIVILGGLLASKKTLKEWVEVEKNVSTYLNGRYDETMGIKHVMELSYNDLPYHLKPCLLHMGNFPEDSEIPTKKLYRMWIAEGIVASSNNNSADLKNIANSYLRELVQRSIVEVGIQDMEGMIKTCRLHDLMWDMCTFKAREVNFLHVLRLGTQDDTKEGSSSNSAIEVENLHRLAIHFGQNSKSTSPCGINKASHLRSLIFFNSGPVNNGCPEWLEERINKFKLLRILDLENSAMKEVPKEVGSFIHLRYLSIKGTEIRSLPSSIGNLRCLQTLDLRVTLQKTCVMEIPNELWKMNRLRDLYLPSHEYQVSGFHKLRITGLSSLETLENFDTKISRVTNLSKLENLRKLSIKDYVSTTETLEIIKECQSFKKESLEHLALKVDGAILEKSTNFLSHCNHCLHTLEVVGTDGGELTLKNVKFPHSLVILVIKNCKLMCGIQALSHLRQLKSLSLDKVSFSDNYMDCTEEGFSELVDLKLSDMNNLKWVVKKETMGKLYRLRIFNCKDLTIPIELPTTMHVVCDPCVTRSEEYSVCPFRKDPLVDDDDDDLATRFCNSQQYVTP